MTTIATAGEATAVDPIATHFASAENPVPGGVPLRPFVARIASPSAVHLPPAATTVVNIRETTYQVHPDLPAIPAWGYGLGAHPTSPGPLLEATADVPARIRWRNRLTDKTLPFLTSVVEADPPNAVDSRQNHPGIEDGVAQDLSRSPIGWLTTHLHGSHAAPESDGWPDHMVPPGGNQYCEYANDADSADLGLAKVGAAQWYHDHAMNATRYHVYSGLAGGYVVRHPDEVTLGLPTSAATGESVLILQDRNLGVDADGTVRMLHKVTTDTAEFFGPLTMVNGKLWPKLALSAGIVRLRVYNGSNARAFRLHALDRCGQSLMSRLLVIGTDAGLLWKAAPAGEDGITLAPAERIDLLVDLRGLADQSVYLVNSAAAPFSGDPAPADLLAAAPADRRPFPQVMRIDVTRGYRCVPGAVWDDLAAGAVLNPEYRRLVHKLTEPADPQAPAELALPDDHEHRLILLSESDPPGHLQLTEVARDDDGTIEIQLPYESAPKRYSAHGPGFYDGIGVMPLIGQWEVWRFLNTTGDTHPMHIHQSTFQPLGSSGTCYTGTYSQETRSTTAALVPAPVGGPADPSPRSFEPAETMGWKDTLRIDPGQLVSVAIRFDLVGRYVYHCHVIEHEDNEMMRPILVTPVKMEMSGHAH